MKKLIFLLTIAGILLLAGCTKDSKHVGHIQIVQEKPVYILEETK